MKKTLLLPSAALLVMLATRGFTQSVPQLVNYQGQLLDAGGNALPTGDYTVQINLFPVDRKSTV